jgi:hypothetical protein
LSLKTEKILIRRKRTELPVPLDVIDCLKETSTDKDNSTIQEDGAEENDVIEDEKSQTGQGEEQVDKDNVINMETERMLYGLELTQESTNQVSECEYVDGVVKNMGSLDESRTKEREITLEKISNDCNLRPSLFSLVYTLVSKRRFNEMGR